MKRNKITIEIHSLLKDVIRNIWVVILCGLIGFMSFYVVTHSAYDPEYTASATLVVNATSSGTGSYSALTTSNEKAKILVNIFTEPSIRECAAEYLGIDSFDGKVTASVMESTNFIELRVTSNHPEKSYNLLNAVINSHHKVSNKIFRNAGVSVIRMPSMPVAPSNRIDSGNRNLVVAASVTVSLAIILALSIMRNTVKKESDFTEKIDSKLIGTITHEDKKMTLKEIRQKKKKGLLIHSNAYISLRFTENFHKIAAKLEHMKNSNGDKVFAITSVAENEGKSTCAANIAVSLADRGNKVVLLDFDFKKPALYKIFNEETTENGELSDLLNKKVDFDDFAFRAFKKTSLSLAINTKPDSEYHSLIENGSIEELIEKLREQFDYVIVDTAPLSLDSTVTDIICRVDKTIMVIRTDTVIIDAINDHISTVSKISPNLAGCILNDVHLNILPFSITGNDESSRYGRYGYGYGKYSHYGHYGKSRSHSKESRPEAEEATAD
ncbi:MAG: AAA family ATPase [Clostridia bacterium]|nr:AAA family ATPase [Clostridia bacterium]